MKIIQLEYFCAVCRYHSITQAAQKLYVTQPAISNAIRELEKEFSIRQVTPIRIGIPPLLSTIFSRIC